MPDFSPTTVLLDRQAQQSAYGTILELLEVDASPIGGNVIRICSSGATQGVVTFLGMTFVPIPFASEGWAWDSTGNPPRPEITIADVDGLVLADTILYQDLVGLNVKRWLTTTELLHTGTYRGPEIWKIIRKVEADGSFVKFELGTILDMQEVRVPRRQMFTDDFPALGRSRVR